MKDKIKKASTRAWSLWRLPIGTFWFFHFISHTQKGCCLP